MPTCGLDMAMIVFSLSIMAAMTSNVTAYLSQTTSSFALSNVERRGEGFKGQQRQQAQTEQVQKRT